MFHFPDWSGWQPLRARKKVWLERLWPQAWVSPWEKASVTGEKIRLWVNLNQTMVGFYTTNKYHHSYFFHITSCSISATSSLPETHVYSTQWIYYSLSCLMSHETIFYKLYGKCAVNLFSDSPGLYYHKFIFSP